MQLREPILPQVAELGFRAIRNQPWRSLKIILHRFWAAGELNPPPTALRDGEVWREGR